MEQVRPFTTGQLEAIARILADTEEGLTATEIAYILKECRIPDVSPSQPKEKRLLNALLEYQANRNIGNHVLMFITRAMNPANYKTTRELFTGRQMQLSPVLALSRMALGDDGKVRRVRAAPNADDPLSREERLIGAMKARGAHEEVLKTCRAELLQTNYCQAVFEALGRTAARVQSMSGLASNGTELVRQAFGTVAGKQPLVALNALSTETERAEQRAFTNLLAGLFGTVRNPTAHNPKIEWEMKEQDAIDVLTLASLVHRTLDRAIAARPAAQP
jgi:uncharacterized protein (TIGR02391 family)